MFYAQSTAKGHMRVKRNVFLPQVQNVIHCLTHMPQLMIGKMKGKMKLNEPERKYICQNGTVFVFPTLANTNKRTKFDLFK